MSIEVYASPFIHNRERLSNSNPVTTKITAGTCPKYQLLNRLVATAPFKLNYTAL